jgi:hypothetical protein
MADADVESRSGSDDMVEAVLGLQGYRMADIEIIGRYGCLVDD